MGLYGTYKPPVKFIAIYDPNGGQEVQLPAILDATTGTYVIGGVSVTGLGLTTAGVNDSANKRFVSDAELASLVILSSSLTETLLAGNIGVDMNAGAETTLYTVPGGVSAIITKVVVRTPSISLTTASYSFGSNAGTDNDWLATATHTGLDGATKAIILGPTSTGFVRVAAAGVFAVKVNILQGAPATAKMDVFGYLYT